MLNLYISGKAPAPLGTVDFAEIEQNAREKLAKYPGNQRAVLRAFQPLIIKSNRRLSLCIRQCGN